MRRKHHDSGGGASIEHQILNGVLWLTVQGSLVDGDGDRLIAEVSAAVRQHGISRVICDMRRAKLLAGPLSMNLHITRIRDNAALAGVRIATIAAVRTNQLQYVEALAAHNALPMRVFTDGVLAEQWLNDPQQPLAVAS